MKVFKFGGASVKNADAIRNMCNIINNYSKDKLVVVISAMGKTTNALEAVIAAKLNNRNFEEDIEAIHNYHRKICLELFEANDHIFTTIAAVFNDLRHELNQDFNYNQLYDQVVSKGELISTKIIAAYLNKKNCHTEWLDAREYIRTDNNFREGRVDWRLTEELIRHDIAQKAEENILVTQGFIGRSKNNFTITLGREGSDFTAAIFGYCLSADSVTVWKDVPGILNADPKVIPDAILFDELPYKEAAEMTYYGASVIHPKTIKPLANKGIPLHVRSFDQPDKPGTIIHDCKLETLPPTIIIKNEQCLVSFKVIDYTFINEENLSLIFKSLSEIDMKINIMQNSAISFSIVVDYEFNKVERLLDSLKSHFEIRYNTGLKLITVKNYAQEILNKYRTDQRILLEQISRNNYRALIAP
ncbi:aspartate kinase [Fulvivirga sp. 29W222]|uniref:Aspartokinase n=1 Tax=Fulvivirga marina TaxID=2494733 RepID=A0A937FYP3_9BACT|nr:aspartate kinase [Fulvivirga marina]MBL6447237.1 aspartate kinase [Fulvivirga marina]